MLYIENLTFDKELEPINLITTEYKVCHLSLNLKQCNFFWEYLMNDSVPILGNMFIDDICYSKIEKNKIKSFNYNFILMINDKIFHSKSISVESFIKNYIKIFDKEKKYTSILEKLDIPKSILNKKVKELDNLEKIYVYLIISLTIKRKITFINSDYFDENSLKEWKNIETKINQICMENDLLIVILEKSNHNNSNFINHKLTISNSYDNLLIKKTNLFIDISKSITIMFKIPLIIFIIFFSISFIISLLLSYSFGHRDIWSIEFITTYLIYSLSIASIVLYIAWIFLIFYKYKGFINNIPILFRQKIMYLCLHFWIVIMSLTVLSNIINLLINFIIFSDIKLMFWDSNFYMSLGVLITSIVLTPTWIISFQHDEKIKKITLRIGLNKDEK